MLFPPGGVRGPGRGDDDNRNWSYGDEKAEDKREDRKRKEIMG